jgi:hypothetical protein
MEKRDFAGKLKTKRKSTGKHLKIPIFYLNLPSPHYEKERDP